MIVGGRYVPECAVFAVPNLWTIMNSFSSFVVDKMGKYIKRVKIKIYERVTRMNTTKKKSSEWQESDRRNFSKMNE